MPDDADYEMTLAGRASHDPVAFQTLYELYFERLYSYVMARLGNREDAEDVVSGIFLNVIKGLRSFKNHREKSFAAWIFTIARNTLSDFVRQRSRQPQAIDFDGSLEADEDMLQPEPILIQRERESELRTMLALLPERRREVLILRYFAGLKNIEIALVLGIDERTVASNLSRGLKDLYLHYGKQRETIKTTSGE